MIAGLMSRAAAALAVLFAVGAVVTPARATDWTGVISTDWFTAGNWLPLGVPTLAITVNIDTITPNATVVVASPPPGAQAGNLFVGHFGTGMLTIQTGGTVTNSNGLIGFARSEERR